MNFLLFNKKDYDYLVEECMLNEEYSKILLMEIQDFSRTQIADALGMSTDNLDKKISILKKKIKKVL